MNAVGGDGAGSPSRSRPPRRRRPRSSIAFFIRHFIPALGRAGHNPKNPRRGARLRVRQRGRVLFTEDLAAAEVESVAADALVRADLLSVRPTNPPTGPPRGQGVRLVNDRATSRPPSL
jgi:hypothetical protein